VILGSNKKEESVREQRAASRAACLLFFLLIASGATARADEITPGKIAPKVVCEADASQTYALYLPSTYTTKRRWPILCALDPAARGAVPVERFREAAEKYGYIVAGSNNSKNGPWAPSATALTAMMNDVAGRFSTDPERVYLTGFSGGARVACRAGMGLKGQVAGVIACSAGFPSQMKPTATIPFVLFGTAGVDDFNYTEVKQLGRTLHGLGIPDRIEVFEGGHSWPPPEVCTHAIEWLEIQAMKSGRREKSDALVESLLAKGLDRARKYEEAHNAYEAYLNYNAIAEDFKGLRDVNETERKARELGDSAAVKQALKQESDQQADQSRRSSELYSLRGRLAQKWSESADEPEDRVAARADLRRVLADLKKRSEAKESTPDRAVARRVLTDYFAYLYETAMSLVNRKEYDQAASHLAIDAEAMPDNWRVLFTLASIYSLKGDKRKSIDFLKKAVEKGFSNVAELENDEAFNLLRGEAAYAKIVEALKRKS
jgi:predicted esterase